MAPRAITPAQVAYVTRLLARAEAMGFPVAALVKSQRRGSSTKVAQALLVRAAVANAAARAGIAPVVFREIPAARQYSGRFRDALYRPALRTRAVEALIAELTAGIAAPAGGSAAPARQVPVTPAKRGYDPTTQRPQPALVAAFHALPPWAFQDDPAAVATDRTGVAPRPESFGPRAQEQG